MGLPSGRNELAPAQAPPLNQLYSTRMLYEISRGIWDSALRIGLNTRGMDGCATGLLRPAAPQLLTRLSYQGDSCGVLTGDT
jgi:hypothetical protein